ncbi:hypothetical protein [Stenotrophomonas pavanii]|uniref:hypothetical protein n=1 Tax=Stenotrophomonas pavanii TaxID=487698 RepID=UPI0039C6AC29
MKLWLQRVSKPVPDAIELVDAGFDEGDSAPMRRQQLDLLKKGQLRFRQVRAIDVVVQESIKIVLNDQMALKNAANQLMILGKKRFEVFVLAIEVVLDLLQVRTERADDPIYSLDVAHGKSIPQGSSMISGEERIWPQSPAMN